MLSFSRCIHKPPSHRWSQPQWFLQLEHTRASWLSSWQAPALSPWFSCSPALLCKPCEPFLLSPPLSGCIPAWFVECTSRVELFWSTLHDRMVLGWSVLRRGYRKNYELLFCLIFWWLLKKFDEFTFFWWFFDILIIFSVIGTVNPQSPDFLHIWS